MTQCRSEMLHPSPDAEGIKSLGVVPWVMKVQGVLWDGKRHTHKSECKPTDADGDTVKHTCCVCVSHSVCLGPCQDGLLSFSDSRKHTVYTPSLWVAVSETEATQAL